jgi:hypothetical protein
MDNVVRVSGVHRNVKSQMNEDISLLERCLDILHIVNHSHACRPRSCRAITPSNQYLCCPPITNRQAHCLYFNTCEIQIIITMIIIHAIALVQPCLLSNVKVPVSFPMPDFICATSSKQHLVPTHVWNYCRRSATAATQSRYGASNVISPKTRWLDLVQQSRFGVLRPDHSQNCLPPREMTNWSHLFCTETMCCRWCRFLPVIKFWDFSWTPGEHCSCIG